MIIMLQWLCLYTLGSRGSRELKTFLETRLISSRVNQKLKNKEGKYMFLKMEIASKSWAMEAIVEAVCKGRGSGSLGRRRSSWMDHEFASIFLRNGHEFHHDRAAIGPRSRRDRAMITPRSGHDRGPGHSSIAIRSTREDFATPAPRSWLDRGVLPRILRAVR